MLKHENCKHINSVEITNIEMDFQKTKNLFAMKNLWLFELHRSTHKKIKYYEENPSGILYFVFRFQMKYFHTNN